jgi:hypothetical protein
MIDSTGTYHAGYAVAAFIYIAYTFSLWRRAKKLRANATRADSPE